MVRLAVFDLDSTLAPVGGGMQEKEVSLFRQLEETGLQIAICSGKSCDYLCGFMRQIGLKNPILIGENGAVIRKGIQLPPKEHYRVPYSLKAKESLQRIRIVLEEEFPGIWFQPNKVGVTVFPRSEGEFEQIAECIHRNQEKLQDIEVYRHCDSFDIVPCGINKAVGIRYVLKLLRLTWEEVIAIGDGVNDYCMFELAGYSLGVNVKEEQRVNENLSSTYEMLLRLQEIIKKGRNENDKERESNRITSEKV